MDVLQFLSSENNSLNIWPSKTDLNFPKRTSCSELAVPKRKVTKNITWAGIIARKYISTLLNLFSSDTNSTHYDNIKKEENRKGDIMGSMIKQSNKHHDLIQAHLLARSRGAWNNDTPGTLREFCYFERSVEP